jgi:hypothetical protein
MRYGARSFQWSFSGRDSLASASRLSILWVVVVKDLAVMDFRGVEVKGVLAVGRVMVRLELNVVDTRCLLAECTTLLRLQDMSCLDDALE